ncbi:MAG: S8 family serine peptidase [Paramuribaculum sp.]|nr:S8 family serine peptidase [Paramuribaculum sp.]
MKKLLLIALTVFVAAGASAQSKFTPASRIMINEVKMYPSRSDDRKVSAIVRLQPGTDASVLAKDGVEILSARGRFATVAFPIEIAETLAAIPEVVSISFGQKVELMMDTARVKSAVSYIQDGLNNGFTQNYKGSGVLLGMMDQGLDPNHINFYNADGTASRVIGLTTILGTSPTVTNYDTPEKIFNFGTENAESTHATHVAGIMGGAYNGIGQVARLRGINLVRVQEENVPFYGVAPEAELYPCVGSLYTTNIITAVQIFADKAKELGKPGAFNLSVGYVPGPHDGTDEINEALADAGEDIIICVAAGNDGDKNVTLRNDFAVKSEIKTILAAGAGGAWEGAVETWSDNANKFSMSFALVDNNTGKITTIIPIPDDIPEDKVAVISGNNSSDFAAAFDASSMVQVASEVNPRNNRFNVYMSVTLNPKSGSNIVPALIYTGTGNTKINSYSSGDMTFAGYPGSLDFTAGNPDQSINNIACGKNIIVVGAYTTKVKWPVLSKVLIGYTSAAEVGDIAPFTSYGDVFGENGATGKTLPEICAPGFGVVSSYSRYYVSGEKLTDQNLCATATTEVNTDDPEGRPNQWGIEAGTSMATPYVTGTAALLLEADPTLKVDRVREILTSSAIPQNVTGSVATQWGAGKLNADDAMRKLLGMPAEIGNVKADTQRRFSVQVRPEAVEAVVAGEKNLTATLHSLAGVCVATAEGNGDTVTFSTGSLSKGVYVLTVTTPAGVKASRTILLQ